MVTVQGKVSNVRGGGERPGWTRGLLFLLANHSVLLDKQAQATSQRLSHTIAVIGHVEMLGLRKRWPAQVSPTKWECPVLGLVDLNGFANSKDDDDNNGDGVNL